MICVNCGEEHDGSGGLLGVLLSLLGNSFLNPPDFCFACKKKRLLLLLAILVFPFIIIYLLLYKFPRFIYGKTGKIGLLIYFVVLAVLGFGVYYKIESEKLAKIAAEKEAAEKQAKVAMVKDAAIEAEALAAKAAETTDLAVKKAAEEAAIKAQKLEEETGLVIITDSRDGKKYKTVKIGTQTWMAENLNYKASGSKCYGNQESNCVKYGRLYDWNAAIKACPKGWHLPSKAEWDVLTEASGGSYLYNFSDMLGGRFDYSYDDFGDFDKGGYWWSANKHESNNLNAYYLSIYNGNATQDNADKLYGHSVRCLQDG